MSRFGAKVIGKAAADTETVIRKHHGRKFGSRVIGDILQRKHEIAALEAEEAASTLSDPKAKMAKRRAAQAQAEAKRAESAAEVETIEAPVTANLDELEAALGANAAFYETLFESEKARADGVRKGALRLFLAHEMDNENREERLIEIQSLLKG